MRYFQPGPSGMYVVSNPPNPQEVAFLGVPEGLHTPLDCVWVRRDRSIIRHWNNMTEPDYQTNRWWIPTTLEDPDLMLPLGI